MESVKIRLGHTDSVNSVNRKNFLDVELKNTSRISHFTDIKSTIDQYEQFEKERKDCNRYRLITTINPFCTNVLFNTFTETVYAEGSVPYENFNGCEAIVDGSSYFDGDISKEGYDKNAQKAGQLPKDNIYSKRFEPNRVQMIMNTEYSRPGCANDSYDKNGRLITDENYVYHPGYDIFDNHILRNRSFKIVNKSRPTYKSEFFNTLCDNMRYPDGKDVYYNKREKFSENGNGDNEILKGLNKHLYDKDNILEFGNGDIINAALTEENGWYGFLNTSTIQPQEKDNTITNKSVFNELNIGRVLNDKKSCEFIDMYPDRTLYSFNPKYNKYQHRNEYNWEVILTYPYKQTNEPTVVEPINVVVGTREVETEGETPAPKETEEITTERNALRILSAVKTTTQNGETVVLIRSLTKHGLKRGDTVWFYYHTKGTDENWYQIKKNFIVRNVGDLRSDNKEYYFYINDLDFIRLLNKETADASDNSLVVNTKKEFRFARVVGSMPSKYYVRIFKKLPNFKYAEKKFSPDGDETIDEYIEEYARYPKEENKTPETEGEGENNTTDTNEEEEKPKMVLFDKEQYKLGFENTIYNDASTQITFTDTIDIDNLIDNRGCPLTEMYLTVIKTNYGHEKWYGITDEGLNKGAIARNDESVEFSHCFGKVSEGLLFSQNKTDISNDYIRQERQDCGDVCMIYNNYNYQPDETTTEVIYGTPFNHDVTIDKDEFLGDIVEFNPNECIEKSLQPFMHRFNTAQRELNDGRVLHWHEIWADDWDAVPDSDNDINFIYPVDGIFGDQSFAVIEDFNQDDFYPTYRPEGYYYQPHYRVQLREFGSIEQDGHFDISINTISPVQADAIYLRIASVRRSGVSKGDIVLLCDDKNSKVYEFIVTYVENSVSFYVLPYTKGNNPWYDFRQKSGMNWLDICNLCVPDINGEIKLNFRVKNPDIPSYAVKVGKNKYLWRGVLKPGNSETNELPEYAYSNNAFYITKEVNFFLKRQDPHGWNDLYCKNGFPNDISGKVSPESKYSYKEESEAIC